MAGEVKGYILPTIDRQILLFMSSVLPLQLILICIISYNIPPPSNWNFLYERHATVVLNLFYVVVVYHSIINSTI